MFRQMHLILIMSLFKLWHTVAHHNGQIGAYMKRDTKIIALAGKGGVGKTSIAAAMVKVLTQKYKDKRILAIDADPAVGLSTALGVEVHETIDDIRKAVISTVDEGDTRTALELLSESEYRIYDAMTECDGFAFLAVGRPEGAGCYCKVNSYLKAVIQLLAENFDYVIIDGEAGIEQVNRRVMEKVTHLLLVTDASKKGMKVIQSIKKVADELVMYEKAGVIANRILSKEAIELIDAGDIPIVSYIFSDEKIAEVDLKGESVLSLPDDARIIKGAAKALINIGLLEI